MTHTFSYDLHQLVPFINWGYFFYTWRMNGTNIDERVRESLLSDALAMIDKWNGKFKTHARVMICEAHSNVDDIVLSLENGDEVVLPMLRQQTKDEASPYYICLSDFISPVQDKIALFAVTVDQEMEKSHDDDHYGALLTQTVCDRLAEATAEFLHRDVRRNLWGYAPDENLDVNEMLANHFQGIRPAVGYPSLPDLSINFLLEHILKMSEIGIRLTENGAMRPHASVSGLMISHPAARYFNLGKLGEDQIRDYAGRRRMDVKDVKRFIKTL